MQQNLWNATKMYYKLLLLSVGHCPPEPRTRDGHIPQILAIIRDYGYKELHQVSSAQQQLDLSRSTRCHPMAS